MLKPIEVEVKRLHNQAADAITLWPFILYRKGYKQDQALRAHEYYHWRQAFRWGVIPWYALYLCLLCFYFRKPSREHPLEKPAYQRQDQVMRLLASGQDVTPYLPS